MPITHWLADAMKGRIDPSSAHYRLIQQYQMVEYGKAPTLYIWAAKGSQYPAEVRTTDFKAQLEFIEWVRPYKLLHELFGSFTYHPRTGIYLSRYAEEHADGMLLYEPRVKTSGFLEHGMPKDLVFRPPTKVGGFKSFAHEQGTDFKKSAEVRAIRRLANRMDFEVVGCSPESFADEPGKSREVTQAEFVAHHHGNLTEPNIAVIGEERCRPESYFLTALRKGDLSFICVYRHDNPAVTNVDTPRKPRSSCMTVAQSRR